MARLRSISKLEVRRRRKVSWIGQLQHSRQQTSTSMEQDTFQENIQAEQYNAFSRRRYLYQVVMRWWSIPLNLMGIE